MQRAEGSVLEERHFVSSVVFTWKEEDLPGRRKGDKVKLALTRRLRRETTMSLKWIARRLHTGSWPHVSNLLHEKRNG